MLNRIQLIGHLGHDPEIRLTKDGREFLTFSIATNYSFQEEDGNWHKTTDWHKVSVFSEKLVKSLRFCLKKGKKVFVEGRISYSTWQDKLDHTLFGTAIIISKREGNVEILSSEKIENQDHPVESIESGGSRSSLDHEL